MKRIDAHMHFTKWYTKDGESALELLGKYYKDSHLDGADIMCCSNNGDLWSNYEADECILAAIVKNEYPQTYIHGCMMLPNMIADGEKIPEEFSFTYQLEMLNAMGFDGIKFCEFKPDSFKVNKIEKYLPDFEKYFDYCEEKDIPMCWHIADPEEFWDIDRVPEWAKKSGWFYGDGSFPPLDKLYELTYEILDRHPKLRVMLAHAFFMSQNPDKMVRLLDKYPNVTIDLSPGWEMFDGFRHYYDKWYDIFRKYSDRFLFATDADMAYGKNDCNRPATNVLRFLETNDEFETPANHFAHGIALEKEPLENVLYKNCERILGDKPKKLDLNILKEYCKIFMPYIPESVDKLEIEKYLKRL